MEAAVLVAEKRAEVDFEREPLLAYRNFSATRIMAHTSHPKVLALGGPLARSRFYLRASLNVSFGPNTQHEQRHGSASSASSQP